MHKDIIDNKKKVCLFGVGTLLNDCYHQILLFLGREPDFLCDNAQGKWGKEFFGRKCISPSELGKLYKDLVVIITVKNFETIYKQLLWLGIKDVFVSCYDRGYNIIRTVKRPEGDLPAEAKQEPFINQVKGKWTLITGASRGVGRQIAIEMAKLGANIVAHSRSVFHAKEVIDTCSAFGVNVLPVAAELSNLNEIDAMLSQLENMVPQIDIVFNNAGISPPCSAGFWSMPYDDFISSYTINTLAPIRICQRLIPRMIQRGFGRVINITSSIQKRPGEMAYACSKAALDKFVYCKSSQIGISKLRFNFC